MSRSYRGAVKPSDLGEASREERALGAVIDVLTHEDSGISVRIRLNKETSEFGALVNGTKITDPSGEMLRRKILKAIEDGLKVEWTPVIEITPIDPDRYNARFETGEIEVKATVDVSRYYIANVGGQKWRKLAWSIRTESELSEQLARSQSWEPPYKKVTSKAPQSRDRMIEEESSRINQKAKFKPPFYANPYDESQRGYHSDESRHHIVAYSDELWAAFTAIGKLFVDAQKKLNTIVGSPDGVRALSAAGANIPKLLGSGK